MTELDEITDTELTEIITLIRAVYGYDFQGYARTSLRRRVRRCLMGAGLQTAAEMRERLLSEPQFFAWFLQNLTVNVTEMFRDPGFFRTVREYLLPQLATYPTIRIWHAGCSTGEEVFSMAILMHEAGLLNRTRLYATDLNPANLERARSGIVHLQEMKNYTANYLKSGGSQDFSSYYTALYQHALIRKELRTNIVFSQHNLVTDRVFNEFQLIVCRNVLIYFNRELQRRVIRLFHDSLVPRGYLALGTKESLLYTDQQGYFEDICKKEKIYRRQSD